MMHIVTPYRSHGSNGSFQNLEPKEEEPLTSVLVTQDEMAYTGFILLLEIKPPIGKTKEDG